MKYLASDLDGTLIQSGDFIKKEDIDAVLKFKEKGNKLIVSTGRKLEGIKLGFSKYPEIKYDYAIGCNGGVIVDNKGETIYENKIPNDIAKLIFKKLFEMEGIFIHFDNEEIKKDCQVEIVGKDKDVELEYSCESIISREDVLKLEKDYAMIALAVLDRDINKAEEMKNLIIDEFGDYLEVYRNQYFVDMAPKGCSKGNGIKILSELLNIDKKDIVTIGDSYNDLSMFEVTENSYTFTYAEKEVQANANNVVGNVAECIENII